MRNLRNIRFDAWRLADITSTCWDPAKDELLCTLGPTETRRSIELVRIADTFELQSHTIASWDVPSPHPDVPADSVVSLHHFSDTSTTCVILAGGDIVTIKEPDAFSSQDDVHIEIIGSIDAGITAARWSPDDELLLVTTKDGKAVFMGRTFDAIADVSMTSEDLKASKHVSVGWGKKETQFEGRGAKALRDPTIPEKVDEGVLSPKDDGSSSISWRGDGAYVAVNSVEGGFRRVVRVYSREGVLDSASEPVDGLEGTLSWRPAGNLIAAIQRRSDRIDVVFFERNGLRHGDFTLRSPGGDILSHDGIRLEWNNDSTVLAVILSDTIQLWTMGNYHYYLKQEVPITSPYVHLAWHPEKALRFAAATSSLLTSAEYIFTVARGSQRPPHDHGAVAVIDGHTAKITPFRTANMPPPMTMFDLEEASSVVDVVFDSANSSMAVLHRTGIDVYAWQTKGSRSLHPKRVSRTTFFESSSTDDSPRVPLQACFSSSEEISVLVHDGGDLKVEVYSFGPGDSNLQDVVEIDRSEPISSISSYCGLPDIGAYAQDRSGKLYNLSGQQGLMPLGLRLPVQLPWCQLVAVGDNTVAVGMARNGRLYADSRLIAKNCTSFVVTDAHIIFTTTNHFLKFVHLVDPQEMEVPEDDPEVDERCRSIERGARLVTAMPTNMSLVLQMPRGNLETIYPRAMVVAGIRQLVEEKNYGRAFSYCRTQRVDMNILYDHRPNQFLANVGLFLDQIQDVAYIDLFLSSLREEDVAQTMYKDTKRTTARDPDIIAEEAAADSLAPQNSGNKSKVNKICNAVLKALQHKKETHLQNIITAHVCKVPPALDDGLTLVAELVQEDEKLAEKAVEHICFLVDVNLLYDHALGLYNLDLALLVAQQSQRDPREYLPFIQNLHKLPELRRRFEIDDHLNRRSKALAHLKALDAFDELQAYTTKHALYQDALGLCRYERQRHRTLINLFAEYLESKSKFREAGLAFESLGNYEKAMVCYRSDGATSWRECLFAAQQVQPPLSKEALTDQATTLAEALTEAKDHASAATLHLDYLDSLEGAVRSLCKGNHFAEALRLLAHRSRADLVPSVFDPALVDTLSTTTEFLADCKSQLRAQVPRILELRRRAAEDPLAFYEGERAGGADGIPDDVSVAASSRLSTGGASLLTRYTGKGGGGGARTTSTGTVGTGVSRATSKNRRREEKKRARGRKGTVYEEEYLVNSVRRLVDRVGAVRGEVGALVFALVRRDMAERARAVETLVDEVVEGCRTAVAEVFGSPEETEQQDGEDPNEGLAGGGGGGGGGVGGDMGYVATGGAGVFHEYLEARNRRQEVPLVQAVQKLSLLGG
ncbi:IKI3 family protein [Sodiomyces alkalinus F11]|uniref:Elongator complex protein 1 n=1 Tax=Sodiomyces alkalinus (strain CBS 110278 / VKM F-3762 / F11) TaxID=1314773 RepID=A0A3N2QAG8_SODAK|nr:IKI3 family protein [Sodiomyces alkalinus F11]ROT43726.1 IKI3 family protein [Sodiomyces alkalinus F11]